MVKLGESSHITQKALIFCENDDYLSSSVSFFLGSLFRELAGLLRLVSFFLGDPIPSAFVREKALFLFSLETLESFYGYFPNTRYLRHILIFLKCITPIGLI
jgi:hypothetical protein